MTAHQKDCKIRRTFHSFCAAYPEASAENIVRMVARRMGIRMETVVGALGSDFAR